MADPTSQDTSAEQALRALLHAIADALVIPEALDQIKRDIRRECRVKDVRDTLRHALKESADVTDIEFEADFLRRQIEADARRDAKMEGDAK